MFVGLVLGAVTVAQKVWNDLVPEAVMVNPMFILESSGTVFVKCLCAQNNVIFWLVIKAPVPSAIGVGSHQVPFPMCTLETLQKYCSTGSLLLTFC